MGLISGNVPEHLVVGARTGFLVAQQNSVANWRQVAGMIAMNGKSLELVDVGGAPWPLEGSPVSQSMVEKSLIARPRDWSIMVGISYNATKDDQTGTLETKVRSASENFDLHMNKLVFQALNGGDGSNYGLCYDGLTFFNDSHFDKGAAYQTVQDNNYSMALSLDNFNTALIAAQQFLNDQGEYTEHNYDTLIVPPAYNFIASQIAGNQEAYDTGNREKNPFFGKLKPPVVSPRMDSTAWILAATSQVQKPIYLTVREVPALQSAWFDPQGADGGIYWFKYYGRYSTVYGDWRLALLGHS